MAVITPADPASARMAQTSADIAACQGLRHLCFHGRAGLDADHYDADFEHVMIERGDTLVGTLRLRLLPDGADFSQTYTGSFYDFGPICGPTLEVGRFCLKGDGFSLDILQQAWARGLHLEYQRVPSWIPDACTT